MDTSVLPGSIVEHQGAAATTVNELPEDGLDLEKLIENVEIGLIQQALDRTNQSRKKSASLLGLTARSLRYRLQKYELDQDEPEEATE